MEQELAERRGQPSPGPEMQPAIISLILAPGQIRGGGQTRKLTVPQGLVEARLLLKVGETRDHSSYQAVILNSDGTQVWSRKGVRVSRAGGAQFVVLKVPARLLAEDDYEINLKGLTDGEYDRVGDYYFTVLR